MKQYRQKKKAGNNYSYSAEIATRGKRIEQGTLMHNAIEDFRDSLQIGDTFRCPVSELTMQYDGTIRPLRFTVVAIHPHVAYLQHVTGSGVIRGESMDYFKLMRCGRRCTDAAR